MCTLIRSMNRAGIGLVVPALVFAWMTGGCTTPAQLAMRAERYRIDVQLDPITHRIEGRTVIDLTRLREREVPTGRPIAVELMLHPDLKIKRVKASGATIRHRFSRRVPASKDDPDGFRPRKHYIVLQRPVDAMTLFVDFEGKLHQDVAAGEKPGAIHNFSMRAHVGEDGIYLGDGYWYPQPAALHPPAPLLAEFLVVADPVPGFELVAGAERDMELSEATGRLAWRSPYPLDGMVLVGGRHEVHSIKHGDVEISLHLKPDQSEHAEGLFEATRRYLDRYQPLIGPYPAREFRIVDNFFSSGFAFPNFTLLASAVINMGERSQTSHGYIDHEMLHSWWGNGVHVDPSDGNWCEALASYGANYYGHVLDGNLKDARRTRRNYCHFLSKIKPDRDKPLGTYGRKDGCSRGIAYSKGAMVFHMLAQKMGQDRFWSAMRRMTAEYVGRYASWDDIRRLCEEESGLDLETFFNQWVRTGGAPHLVLESARYDSAGQTLMLALTQGEPAFELDVPLRVTHAGGTVDVIVPFSSTSEEIAVSVEVIPTSVELDPDYNLFRKASTEDVIPTTAATRYGTAFASVIAPGESCEGFLDLRDDFEESFDQEEHVALTAGSIEEGALAERCVLVLGDAVRDPYVSAFLSAVEFPVQWTAGGFTFEGVTYSDPGHAVVCTIRHPGVEGGGITVFSANSEETMPPARNIPFYDQSLLIFKDGAPILRRDFERRQVVQVEPAR